jgi:hypothetical protein
MSSTVIVASAKNKPPTLKPPNGRDLNDLSSSSLYAVEISYGVSKEVGEASETTESDIRGGIPVQGNLAKPFE